ncbi:hypothetical protein R5R35_001110 [Gryllus longicercus]|uniref:G2/mitotic-specific cyclin-B3 n=1 Tax=Gryllus longicercus TaxID=2509291 RepID=A0AAN9VLM4_9ORTH
MDLTKQKQTGATSRRSIVTRSQTAATQIKPDLGKFTFSKRKAESPVKMLNKKSVFRDLTNKEVADEPVFGKFHDDKLALATKKLAKTKISEPIKRNTQTSRNKVTKLGSKQADSVISSYFRITKQAPKVKQEIPTFKKQEIAKASTQINQKVLPPRKLKTEPGKASQENKVPTVEVKKERTSTSSDSDISPLYVTALENLSSLSEDQNTSVATSPAWDPAAPPKRVLPPGVVDFDAENWSDPLQVSNYATDIFEYFKGIEPKFCIKDYMFLQKDLTSGMRTVVVDWMVELQENFELNHETLYLAVKILDTYLSKVLVKKTMLQLVAAASLFVASKYDERFPPSIEDHLYVCEGAYTKSQLMEMEISILKHIDYNLGFPISYRFLRRYARFAQVSMPTLTLARYILEYSLMDYSFISQSDSKLAAAALLLALKMKGTHEWSPNLQYASGYAVEDLKESTEKLNAMLHRIARSGLKLNSIKNKYSHKIFFEVAKMPLLEDLSFS